MDDSTIDYMLSALEAPVRDLSAWEENFVESVTEQWKEKHWLSERQQEILERIYSEKT